MAPSFRVLDVWRHFRYYSALSFMLVKHPSESAEEARIKARCYQIANRCISSGTMVFGAGSLGAVMRYCLRADKPLRKVALVALYLVFLRDVVYLGSNAGLCLVLPRVLNQLLLAPPDCKVGQTASRVRQLAAEGRQLPELDRVAGYLNGQSAAGEAAHPGFVQNPFFARNPHLVPAASAAPAFFYRYAEESPAWAALLGPADCLVARRLARKLAALTYFFA